MPPHIKDEETPTTPHDNKPPFPFPFDPKNQKLTKKELVSFIQQHGLTVSTAVGGRSRRELGDIAEDTRIAWEKTDKHLYSGLGGAEYSTGTGTGKVKVEDEGKAEPASSTKPTSSTKVKQKNGTSAACSSDATITLKPLYRTGMPEELDFLKVSKEKGDSGKNTYMHAQDQILAFMKSKGLQKDCHLFEHQLDGILWMLRQEAGDVSGGILADDMGLGKTLQMLCLIAATKAPTPDLSKTHATSTLIITETSVLNSWKDDFFKHFSVNGPTDPDVPTTKSKGKTKQTEPLSTSSSTLTPNSLLIWHDRKRTKDPAEIAKHTIVITTYGTALSDLATLERVSWCRIVLDEAQKIKNGSSKKSNKTFQAVIRLQAYRRWCLTGTPMENSTSDIVSLMMFLRVNPQTISDFTTAADRNPPIKAAQILRSLMLLRTKAELSKNGLGMPTCHRLKLYLEMTEKELEILEKYKMGDGKNALANLMFERRAVNGLLPRSKDGASSKYSSGWDDEEEDGEATDGMAVGTVQPKSFSKEDINYFEGTKLDAVFKLIRSILNSDPQFLMDLNFTLESPTEQSSKVTASVADPQLKGSKLTQPTKHPSLSAALQLLTSPPTFRIRPNSHDSHEPSTSSQAPRTNPPNASSPPKVVIFSQWTTMLDLIGAYLEESKVPFQRLDGQMSPAKRKEALEKFAETDASKNSKRSGIQPQILLLSLKAGGVGLNIHANVAVLIDPWYNPMVEKQAFDRIYRLSSPYTDIIFVRIYAMNSIEARVKEIGDSKTETWERLKDLMLRQ